MKEKTKFVALSTREGGVGKTTLTMLTVFYLHYIEGFNAAVIGYGYPQHSIVEMWEHDLKLALGDEHYKGLAYEQFARPQKKACPVVESNMKGVLADTDYLLPQGDSDYVFFDLPDTTNSEDLIHSLVRTNHLVAPISADRVVMENTLNYTVVVKEYIMGRREPWMKRPYMLWGMVNRREKAESYRVYGAVMKKLDLPVLKIFPSDTKRSRREQNTSHRFIFCSILFPVDRSLIQGNSLSKLVDELIELLKQDLMSGKEYDDGLDASFIISRAENRSRPLHLYASEKEEEVSALSEPSGETAPSSTTKEEGRRRGGKGQNYECLFI